ncbi:MAG: hypothetical protein WC924_02260 [Candidatus Gracilibacteria bacterium]
MKNFYMVLAMSLFIFSACSTEEIETSSTTDDQATEDPITDGYYTNEDFGIAFSLPTDWSASTDENGNLYAYTNNPYESVSFTEFKTQTEWQDSLDLFSESQDSFTTTETTIGYNDYATTLLVFARNGKAYNEYFVNAGGVWFRISSSAESAEVAQIIDTFRAMNADGEKDPNS